MKKKLKYGYESYAKKKKHELRKCIFLFHSISSRR